MEKFTIMQGGIVSSEIRSASKEIKDISESVRLVGLNKELEYIVFPVYDNVASHTIVNGEVQELDIELLGRTMAQSRHLLGELGSKFIRPATETVTLNFGNNNIGDAVKTLDVYNEVTADEIIYHIQNKFKIRDVNSVSVYSNSGSEYRSKFKFCIGFSIVGDELRVTYVKNTPIKYYTWRHMDRCGVTSKSRISRILGNIVLQGAEK
ncbi:MAG: hypothetical protein ACRCXX_09955 [Cetobacterium sp.]|uniref:hypothetical protein n=1 Tax=Cetobacterium sp. TaxID=2071632 RepID=UPI003F35D036